MPTSQELHTLLAELQERHPLKDGSRIVLLFGGWTSASADLKDKSIVLPKIALKDAWGYYSVIHEYAHFLSEDRVEGTWGKVRNLHNFLAHDKAFEETERELAAEYGVRFKRWKSSVLEIETPWGNTSAFQGQRTYDLIQLAITCNWLGLVIALIASWLHFPELPRIIIYYLIGLIVLNNLDGWATSYYQFYVRRRYRKHHIRKVA